MRIILILCLIKAYNAKIEQLISSSFSLCILDCNNWFHCKLFRAHIYTSMLECLRYPMSQLPTVLVFRGLSCLILGLFWFLVDSLSSQYYRCYHPSLTRMLQTFSIIPQKSGLMQYNFQYLAKNSFFNQQVCQ